jgi:hypothetical protein
VNAFGGRICRTWSDPTVLQLDSHIECAPLAHSDSIIISNVLYSRTLARLSYTMCSTRILAFLSYRMCSNLARWLDYCSNYAPLAFWFDYRIQCAPLAFWLVYHIECAPLPHDGLIIVANMLHSHIYMYMYM